MAERADSSRQLTTNVLILTGRVNRFFSHEPSGAVHKPAAAMFLIWSVAGCASARRRC
jgi:hypothetical protein